MYIHYNLEHENEKMTNFRLAESVINLCNDETMKEELNAEVVAKMILLQLGEKKEGVGE